MISKSPYLAAHLKRSYETGYTGRFSEKTRRRIQDHSNISKNGKQNFTISQV